VLKRGATSATAVQPVAAAGSGIGALFKMIVMDVAAFPWSDQGNQYLLTAMDYFTKWPEAYAIPNQRHRQWWKR
jgi:hypothetical protein